MIVSQIALLGVGPSSSGAHTVLITNLEAVTLTFSIELALNQAQNPFPDQAAVTNILKAALTVGLSDSSTPLSWKRSGDLHRTAARKTIPAGRSGAIMLIQSAVSVPAIGLYLTAGTVDVTLPVVVGGTSAAPKATAQLDHPARVLVTVFHRVGYQPNIGTVEPIWPMHLVNPLPPVGGSCEFLVPPEQPAVAVRSRRPKKPGPG
jgi:hypothetical protein